MSRIHIASPEILGDCNTGRVYSSLFRNKMSFNTFFLLKILLFIRSAASMTRTVKLLNVLKPISLTVYQVISQCDRRKVFQVVELRRRENNEVYLKHANYKFVT